MTLFQRFALILLAFRVAASELKDPPGKVDGFLAFLKQHFLPNFVSLEGLDCHIIMRHSFPNATECQEVNTYIVSFPDLLQNVCGSKGKPHYNNLRQSLNKFDLITCKLEGDPTEEYCDYSQHRFSGFITVRCDKYGNPVYLEEGDFGTVMEEEEEEVSLPWYDYFSPMLG